MQERKDKLQKIHFWAYGMGHFINDLVVACWFNFLLFFLKRVAETSVASYVLFIGQVTDGLTTPLVGFFSDKFDTRFGMSNLIKGRGFHGISQASFWCPYPSCLSSSW
jgi:Na+/melibiose symporter-like transporter